MMINQQRMTVQKRNGMQVAARSRHVHEVTPSKRYRGLGINRPVDGRLGVADRDTSGFESVGSILPRVLDDLEKRARDQRAEEAP
jgi:hypothetical protein